LGNVVKKEPLVGAALRAVCTVLVKCRVQEGNEELHKAVDMYLASAWRQKVRLTKDEGGGSMEQIIVTGSKMNGIMKYKRAAPATARCVRSPSLE
jgi:hypothetical protein